MMDVNQTLQGVLTPTVDSLKLKEKTSIACWNVRTLYQTGKLAQVVRDFPKYGLYILGVCEAHWTGSGQRTISIRTYDTLFKQIGWPSYRGSGLDHERENGEDTHQMETIRIEAAQGQVQLKVHQVDSDSVLCPH